MERGETLALAGIGCQGVGLLHASPACPRSAGVTDGQDTNTTGQGLLAAFDVSYAPFVDLRDAREGTDVLAVLPGQLFQGGNPFAGLAPFREQ